MRRILIGVLAGMVLTAPPLGALRFARPPTFTEWNSNTFTQLNDVLLQIYNVVNGRYQMDIVTVDPDGSRRGKIGEAVFFDTGTDQLCVNADGGTTWKCVNVT